MGMMIALTDSVTMANELNSMYIRKPMTLQQMRFFTIYLAKINPTKKNVKGYDKIVRFSIKDFARIMNVEVNEDAIKTNIANLLEHTVWVKSEKYKNGITACHLFRKCEMWKDEELGEIMLEFQCSEEVEPYMFKLKKNFTTYEVWNTLRLRSVIHSRMYQLLKQFQKIGERTILIKDLKEQLGIEKNSYQDFKIFNRDVLKKAQKALKEKTDICFEYKCIGRPAKSIRFTIYENKDYDRQISLAELGLDDDDNIIDMPEPEYSEEIECNINPLDLFKKKIPKTADDITVKRMTLFAAACDYEFTYNQMLKLSQAVVDSESFPYDPKKDKDLVPEDRNYNQDMAIVHYLRIKYLDFCDKRDSGKLTTKNYCNYFIKML